MRQLIALVALVSLGGGLAAADVPLPRPRPAVAVAPHSFAEAAGPDFNATAVTSQPSDCDKQLAGLAAATLLPRLVGSGACGGDDMVELQAVLLPDNTRIAVKPAAVLRCAMAVSFSGWLREEVVPRAAKLGSALREVENYDSYDCRSRNRVAGAKISEHAKGNAIDVRAFHLADGRRIEPTDMMADKDLREALRASACGRFATVLGPGADGYHETHIHLDIAARRSGLHMCQWAVREPPAPAKVAAVVGASLVAPAKAAEQGVLVRVRLPTPRPVILAVKHSHKL
jgi:hypothetical protein